MQCEKEIQDTEREIEIKSEEIESKIEELRDLKTKLEGLKELRDKIASRHRGVKDEVKQGDQVLRKRPRDPPKCHADYRASWSR